MQLSEDWSFKAGLAGKVRSGIPSRMEKGVMSCLSLKRGSNNRFQSTRES